MPDSFGRPRTRPLAAGVAAVATVLVVGAGIALAATRAVAISGFAYSPSAITINVGDRITWTNSDSVDHTATATGGAFDTGNIGQGQSASVRFTRPGTYRYICTPHPTMTGTIRVRAAGGGPTDPPTDSIGPLIRVEPEAGIAAAPLVAGLTLLVGLAIARRRLQN